MIILFAVSQLFRIAIDYCLAKSAGATPWEADSDWRNAYYVSFAGLLVLQMLRSQWLNYFSVRSAEAIHKLVFCRIIQAPVPTFFDTHTVGEVLNKLAKDTEVMDSSVPEFMLQVLINWAQVGSIFALAIWATPYLVILLCPLSYGFYRLFQCFSAVSRDLKRLESVTRSPVYSSLSETLSGLDTIRAYGATSRFLATHRKKMDRNQKLYFHLWMCMSWVTARLEIATSMILFAVAVLCVALRDESDPVSLGLALSYGLQLTALFQRCIQVAIDVSTYMTSVERVLSLQNVPIEQSVYKKEKNVPVVVEGSYALVPSDDHGLDGWPARGVVEFRNVEMQYRENNPRVLRNVSFCTRPGERVGICGRTGSGKSSLLVSLFRIVENSTGGIWIDGINTQDVPLAVLRKRIAIIPQDPVMLTGTLRFQLDPFAERSDADLLEALELVNLKDMVGTLPLGLLGIIAENGENLSHGQRQLLCIARALLRRNKILVIDEGTSSVDPLTDAIIQTTLCKLSERLGCTILCIAHRISTILDFDRILVLSDGRVVEFDTPAELLARPTSLFTSILAASQG